MINNDDSLDNSLETSASTDWLNPVNWTPVGVPTPKDTVILNNGGTINFSAPVTQNGPFHWSAGCISGDPNPFTLGSNAVMTLAPGGFKYLAGAVFNGGTIQTISNITLYVDNNPQARLVNLPGAVINSTEADSFDNGGTAGGVLENRGLFRKSGDGDTILSSSLIFSNSATVDIQTNALQVYNGWHVGGSYTGDGQLRLLFVNHLRGDLTFSNLRLQSGNFDASNARLHGAMTWAAGSLDTSTNAACVVAGDATLTLVPGNKYVAGTLTNEGLMRLIGDTGLYFGTAPVCKLVNATAGVLDSTGADYFSGDGDLHRVLENHGIFRKSGGGGSTVIGSNVELITPGILDLQTGVLQVNGSPIGVASGIRVTLNNSTNYGRLSVGGAVALGGSLLVSRGPGFTPAVNDTFHIVTATAPAGSFATVSGTELGNDLVLQVAYLPTGVDLVAAIDLRPTLTPPTLVGGQIWFQFLSATGAVYSIEYNDDLNTTNWLPRLSIPGDGLLHTISEPATNYPARFFRILRH